MPPLVPLPMVVFAAMAGFMFGLMFGTVMGRHREMAPAGWQGGWHGGPHGMHGMHGGKPPWMKHGMKGHHHHGEGSPACWESHEEWPPKPAAEAAPEAQ